MAGMSLLRRFWLRLQVGIRTYRSPIYDAPLKLIVGFMSCKHALMLERWKFHTLPFWEGRTKLFISLKAMS